MADALLRLATWNIGGGGISAGLSIMGQVDAMALQEASDQNDMMEAFRNNGYGVIRPAGSVGQPATPLVYDKSALTLIDTIVVPLYPGGNIGPGTGPDDGKPKWLIGGRFTHKASGKKVALTSMHCYAGQEGENLRRRVSREMVTKARDRFDTYDGLPFIMGDFNAVPGESTLEPLREHGWTCDHIAGSQISTHGGWTPDHVWWKRDPGAKFVSHRTIPNGSDHDALIVVMNLGPGSGGEGSGGGVHGHGGNGELPDPYDPPGEDPPPSGPTVTSGRGRASLAGRPFRLNPTSINWSFEAKVADIATVGGKVIQVLGTKVSDLVVSGTFGRGGWREQAEFLDWIKQVADRQVENKPPVHFRYPAYGWDIPVYIKAYTTPDGGRSIVLDNGIVAPRWDLVLFVVNSSATLEKVATDAYIARMAKGIGWKQTEYNGPLGIHALVETLGGMSVEQYLEQAYGIGSVPTGNQDPVNDPYSDYTDPVDFTGPIPPGGTPDENRQLGAWMAKKFYGWEGDEWVALEKLWTRESGWRTLAENPSSGAYGIPQSLPGDKMAIVADDWRTNPATQIRWGLRYIKDRYGSPIHAWAHSEDTGWY